MGLGVEQHRGGDDRRHLLDAELLQRRVRRRLHVGSACSRRSRWPDRPGNSPLPSHGSGSTAKWPIASICVPCAPGSPLTVSSPLKACTRAGDADGRPIFVDAAARRTAIAAWCWSADVRKLVGLGLGIGEIGRAALPGGGSERVGHADLVAGRPARCAKAA